MSDTIYPLNGKRIWIAGHKGIVGSALVRRLCSENCEVITVERPEVYLIRQAEVEAWLENTRPDARNASKADEQRSPREAWLAADN